jgi:phenylacetate-CoA ligase
VTFLTRGDLAKAARKPGQGALLFAGSPAEYGMTLTEPEVAAMQALSRRSLEAAGLAKNDKVLFAVAQDGSPAVGLLAQAAAGLAASVAVTSPRGRLRLLSTIRALKPNVLVTTPCGAADFLARLYLEFNVDPIELDLAKIVLVGEIASPGVRKRLAKEFEADLSELYCDPVFGAALAARRGGGWSVADDRTLALGALGSDEVLADGVTGEGELLLRAGEAVIRTGQVIKGDAGDAGLFNHTVGEHVLARGQFVSLPLLRRQLALIDGVARWTLTVDRGDRTLDNLLLTVAFDRESLVANPMWKGRIQQAVAAATPVPVDIQTELALPDAAGPKDSVVDLRGHHLGVARDAAG